VRLQPALDTSSAAIISASEYIFFTEGYAVERSLLFEDLLHIADFALDFAAGFFGRAAVAQV